MEKSEIDAMISACEDQDLIAKAEKTDQTQERPCKISANDIIQHSVNQYKSMAPFILEMKVQVDRWDLIVEKWLISSLVQPYVLENMKKHIWADVKDNQTKFWLWGAEVIFTSDIQEDKILAIGANKYNASDYRHLCLGKLDLPGIQRSIDLKAFW